MYVVAREEKTLPEGVFKDWRTLTSYALENVIVERRMAKYDTEQQ